MVGRRLTETEITAYDLIDPELATRVKIVKVPVLAPGTSGMTLGRHILFTDDTDRSGRRTLMAHELVHVRQIAEQGMPRFLMRYLAHYFRGLVRLRSHRAAYMAIPAEVEARAEAATWLNNLAEQPG